MWWRNRINWSDDSGVFSLLVAGIGLGLLITIGLVVDGGAKITGYQKANSVAEEAARAAGQQVDENLAQRTGTVRVERADARAAALTYLRRAGYDGDVSFSANGRIMTVTARTDVDATFLRLMGVSSMGVEGTARAEMETRT